MGRRGAGDVGGGAAAAVADTLVICALVLVAVLALVVAVAVAVTTSGLQHLIGPKRGEFFWVFRLSGAFHELGWPRLARPRSRSAVDALTAQGRVWGRVEAAFTWASGFRRIFPDVPMSVHEQMSVISVCDPGIAATWDSRVAGDVSIRWPCCRAFILIGIR